ncbi:MAG: hypothetical protein QM790_11815 [Nibricoccus sp.]
MRLFIGVVFFLVPAFLFAAGVHEGMTRDEVEAALGRPISVMQRDNRQMLNYPKGGRVELVDGKVVDMVSVPVSGVPTPTKPADLDEVEVAPEATKAAPANSGQHPKVVAPPTESFAVDVVESDDKKPVVSHARFGLALIVGALVRIGVVMIVLKLAFKWADVHADWSQMFLPALSDTLVRSAFDVAGTYVFRVNNWFYINEAVAYFVLLFVLIKTTHACTLARAVAVAGAAKLMSILVGSLIMVYLLHALS